mmetsp:Transcript_51086/g.111086  ORF Transcript_51086/g.111086 Transcript_51086/m.111086 type:complete len:119 (-) Transcript_51086:294-650(-)
MLSRDKAQCGNASVNARVAFSLQWYTQRSRSDNAVQRGSAVLNALVPRLQNARRYRLDKAVQCASASLNARAPSTQIEFPVLTSESAPPRCRSRDDKAVQRGSAPLNARAPAAPDFHM